VCLQKFGDAWDATLREMTAAAYGEGDIIDDDGPIEEHQSPYCKSADAVHTIVVQQMRGCALAQSRICGAYSVHIRSWHCSFGVSEHVLKEPVVRQLIKSTVAVKRSGMKAGLNHAGALRARVCVSGGGGGLRPNARTLCHAAE
jgi:hypothetical protein